MKKSIITVCILFSSTLFSLAQTIPSYVPDNGLVGWWPFNRNFTDRTGNGHHGRGYATTFVNDRFGGIDEACYFDGQRSHINIPFDLSLTPVDFTISVWIKNDSGLSPRSNIFGQPAGRQLAVYSNGQATVSWHAVGNMYPGIETSNALMDTTWNHVVATFHNRVFSIYLNGIFSNSVTTGLTPYSCTLNDFQIGGFNVKDTGCENYTTGLDQMFKGCIDDVGYWNRALTQQEISQLFFTSAVGMPEATLEKPVIVMPNPCSDYVNVSALYRFDADPYTITDAMGRVVLQGTLDARSTAINTAELNRGIYFLSIRHRNTPVVKVVKN